MKYDWLTKQESKCIINWHDGLNENRGDRARLRRAERPEDLLLTDAFFHFLEAMPDESEQWRDNLLVSAAVAGALAHVKQNKQVKSRLFKSKDDNSNKRDASFAEQLATPLEGKGKAPMSELRFQQLQKSKTTEDFYRRILRAIRLLDGNVNIVSLANDIIHWHKEFEHTAAISQPAKRLAVRWASDYFTTLSNI